MLLLRVPLLAFSVYLFGVVILGLVFSTVAYPVLGPLLGLEFPRFVFRVLELVGLITVVVWLHLLGEAGIESWGLARPLRRWMYQLFVGCFCGVLMLGALVIFLLTIGAREVTGDLAQVPGLFAKGLAVGLAVAVIEEFWFRGGLFSALASPSVTRPRTAIAITSVLFSVVHFIRPADMSPAESPSVWFAVRVFTGSFGKFLDPQILGPALALLLAGAFLAIVRLRTRSVAACIGLHAGWVSVIYVFKAISELKSGSPTLHWATGYDGVIGWLAFVIFLGALLLYRPWGFSATSEHQP